MFCTHYNNPPNSMYRSNEFHSLRVNYVSSSTKTFFEININKCVFFLYISTSDKKQDTLKTICSYRMRVHYSQNSILTNLYPFVNDLTSVSIMYFILYVFQCHLRKVTPSKEEENSVAVIVVVVVVGEEVGERILGDKGSGEWGCGLFDVTHGIRYTRANELGLEFNVDNAKERLFIRFCYVFVKSMFRQFH